MPRDLRAVFVCGRVERRESPLRYAVRDAEHDPADNGWQFLCGVYDHTGTDAQIWAVAEILALDPSLRS